MIKFQMQGIVVQLAVILGTIKTIMLVYEIFRFFAQHFTPQNTPLKKMYPAKDLNKRPWTLITGASDGFGAEFARQLVAEGWNIVLVARNPQKLKNVENELKEICADVETRIIQVDFSAQENMNPDFYHKLTNQVDDLDISLVFANAGCFSIGNFSVIHTLYLQKMLDVNIYHFTMMHKVFLPWLINKRSLLGLKSCMVGTSSVSEVIPMIGFGVTYTASKVMSSYLGRAINWEIKSSKHSNLIDTQVIFPGGTDTNILNRPESSKSARMNAM